MDVDEQPDEQQPTTTNARRSSLDGGDPSSTKNNNNPTGDVCMFVPLAVCAALSADPSQHTHAGSATTILECIVDMMYVFDPL